MATWNDNYSQLVLISVEYPAVELRQSDPLGRLVSFDGFARLD